MKRYIEYLKYVIRHKWFVFLECLQYGMILKGIFHDTSKLLPVEFFPYANFFYEKDGSKKQVRDKTGYYKPDDTGDINFDMAWFHHQKVNKHHWQYWTQTQSDGTVKAHDMPKKYITEMICDWRAAGRAQGVERWKDVYPWYIANKYKMIFSDKTKAYVENILKKD